MTEHLRLNGVYWGLTALHLMGHPDALPNDQTIQFVLQCQNPDGGFGAAPGHDSHMLYTVSAVQILATINALEELEKSKHGGKDKVAACESIGSCCASSLTRSSCRESSGPENRHLCWGQMGRAGHSLPLLRTPGTCDPR